ncbi:hypothetical protein GCM10023350_09160 [Nocardioides endophyticus]|uniref:PaaI family thioesterase n=2 Tax=Nocardioides endophyticus TaxID=1353775 RepID=A0ABP8YEU2_9ACTN
MTAAAWHADSAAARIPLLADAALGRALLAGIDPDWTCRTVDLRLDMISTVPPADETLHCDAELRGMSSDFGVCQADIRLADGSLVATASSQFIALAQEVPWTSPDQGRLTGVSSAFQPRRATTCGPGSLELDYAVDSGMLNLQRMVHGGVQAALLSDGLHRAVQAESTAGIRLLSLNVEYHRPIPLPPGESMQVEATVDRSGRRVAVAHARIASTEGKVQAIAHASFARSGA